MGINVSSLGESGALELVENQTLAAAATSVVFSGLDLDNDIYYVLNYRLTEATNNLISLSLFYNADTTANHYYNQYLQGFGAATAAGNQNNAYAINCEALKSCIGQIFISKTPEDYVYASIRNKRNYQNNMVLELTDHDWNSTANITALTLTSSTANSIATGSQFTLYKMKKG